MSNCALEARKLGLVIFLIHTYALFGSAPLATGRTALLIFVCLAVVLALVAGARKGVLHVPGYIGMAMFAFVVALVLGWLSGIHRIRGSPLGVILSVLFFLLISVSAGSILAIFFFRPPPET